MSGVSLIFNRISLNLNGRNLKEAPVEKKYNEKITGVPVVQLQQ
jgi:hypothetical protein